MDVMTIKYEYLYDTTIALKRKGNLKIRSDHIIIIVTLFVGDVG